MITIFLLLLIILICINVNNLENFCPDKLTYNNYQYYLWSNNNVWQKFLTYYDYLKFYNFMQSNYSMKNIYCKPLYPITYKKNNYNAINRAWKTNRNFRYNLRI